MYHKAIFLDKDGTLVENVPYNADPDKIHLVDGAIEALQALHQAGYKIIVVSNQSGVARGMFPEADLAGVQKRLAELLEEAGLPLDGFYYCPHLPSGRNGEYAVECFCRKPRPGMLFQAGREHELNLSGCWMVGDILDDVEAGRRAGCNTILIDNGGETEWVMSALRQPHYKVPSLKDAASVILESITQDQPVVVRKARPARKDGMNSASSAGAPLG